MTREEFEHVLGEINDHYEQGKRSADAEARVLAHDAEQRAEIARLKNDLSHWTFTRLQQLESENKSLREALKEIADYDAGVDQYPGSCCSGCDSPGIAKAAIKEGA